MYKCWLAGRFMSGWQDGIGGEDICQISLFDPWKSHGVGRRELTPQNCPWHMYPSTSTKNKQKDLSNSSMVKSPCYQAADFYPRIHVVEGES